MAYLRYHPFRVIATPREQHILIVGHLIIFAIEFLLVTALFASGLAPMAGSAFHKLYFICYWPHFFCWCSRYARFGSAISSCSGYRASTRSSSTR